MPTNEDYTPRFIFEITDEQKSRIEKLIGQYGVRRALFSPILDDVLDLIEEYGGVIIGVLISGKIKPREIIPSLSKAESAAKGATHGNS